MGSGAKSLHYNEFIHENYDHLHIHKMTTFIFLQKYIRSSKISSINSLTPLHPFHHALSIQIRCYPVVVQHMKRKRLQQLGVWTLHSKTILERFLSTTYFLQPISFYFKINLVQLDSVSTIFISLHYNHTGYRKRDIIINDLDIMPWLRRNSVSRLRPLSLSSYHHHVLLYHLHAKQ
jgi:hypothetical protein